MRTRQKKTNRPGSSSVATGQTPKDALQNFASSWNWLLPTLALFALGFSLFFLTRGWEKPMLGPHSFRQTQTAITSYYMARDAGMFFDYITPVLGKPWSIPLEVPYYQWIVARMHQLTGWPLDRSGKMVSLLFFFACLWPVRTLLTALGCPKQSVYFSWILLLSSPLYLFWTPVFLMETTALFFALGMAACFVRATERNCLRDFLLGAAFGMLTITCKATTWAVAAGVTLLLVAYLLCKTWSKKRELTVASDADPENTGRSRQKTLLFAVACGVALGLCFLIGKAWLAYGDAIKQENPFAREIILASSEAQKRWNFGTVEQKLSLTTWQIIGRHVSDQILLPLPLLGSLPLPALIAAGLFFFPKIRLVAGIFVLGFAAGPLVFTNLYFEHSYYWVANGVWLLLAAGIVLGAIWDMSENSWPKIVSGILAGLFAISGFWMWNQRFLPILEALPTREALAEAWIQPVQKVVPPGRTLLIVGNDWNPNSLYYAERKGLAFPTSPRIPFPGPQLDEFFGSLRPEEAVGAVVVNPRLLEGSQNQAFWKAFLEQKGFSTTAIPTAFGALFPALDLKFGKLD